MRARLRWPLCTIFVLVVAVLVRIYIGSAQELARAAVSASVDDSRMSVLHYGRAIRWYFPGNPNTTKAIERLFAIEQEHAGSDKPLALNAMRVLFGSLKATRSFYQPQEEVLERAAARIAQLTVEVEGADVSADDVLTKLQEDRDPSILWAALSSLAFLVWIGGVVGFIFNGFSKDGVFVGGRQAALYGISALFAFFLWAAGAWLA